MVWPKLYLHIESALELNIPVFVCPFYTSLPWPTLCFCSGATRTSWMHLRAALRGTAGTVEGRGKPETHPHPPLAESKPILCLWIVGKNPATLVPLPGQGTACHKPMNNPRWGWKKHTARLQMNEQRTAPWEALSSTRSVLWQGLTETCTPIEISEP